MIDRYEKKHHDFAIFLGHNHYEECTGGEENIRVKNIQTLKAYSDAIDIFNQSFNT